MGTVLLCPELFGRRSGEMTMFDGYLQSWIDRNNKARHGNNLHVILSTDETLPAAVLLHCHLQRQPLKPVRQPAYHWGNKGNMPRGG